MKNCPAVQFLFLVIVAIGGVVARSEEPSRLDREDLLQFRGADGRIQAVKTAEDWQKRRTEIVRGMQQVMGRMPDDERRVPLDVKIIEEADAGSYIRRLIMYQSEPDSRTPAAWRASRLPSRP